VKWKVILSKQATKDSRNLARAGLKPHALRLLQLLEHNPYANPPKYEKLVGNLAGYLSRRINIQHRLVYRVDDANHVVHVLRMWTHYE